MIEIVEPASYAAYRAELTEMHRMRFRIFKERLDWEVPAADGLEQDVFDELGPTYLLAFDGERLVGSMRMLPTLGPTMLRDVFPVLLDGKPMPHDPAIWEISRLAVEPGSCESGSLGSANRITSEIFCGLIEHCQAEDIREIVTVYDLCIARILPRLGLLPTWRGPICRVGITRAVAGQFDADLAQLRRVRRLAGITASVLSDRRVPRLALHETSKTETTHVP